jgi:hypothetical protein
LFCYWTLLLGCANSSPDSCHWRASPSWYAWTVCFKQNQHVQNWDMKATAKKLNVWQHVCSVQSESFCGDVFHRCGKCASMYFNLLRMLVAMTVTADSFIFDIQHFANIRLLLLYCCCSCAFAQILISAAVGKVVWLYQGTATRRQVLL